MNFKFDCPNFQKILTDVVFARRIFSDVWNKLHVEITYIIFYYI